jgi:hypothetical protein
VDVGENAESMDCPDLSRLDLGELREQARAAGVKDPPPLTNDASSRARLIDLIIQSRDAVRGLKVRRTPSRPRSWADFSLL